MQHSSTPRTPRWSPVSLDRSMFDAGAEQSLGSQYGYAQTSATTGTMNAYHPHATQGGYMSYTQSTQSSYHTSTTGHSSSQQYPDNIYSTNFQPDLQTSALYEGAPTSDWPSFSSYSHSARPSNC